MLDIDNHHRHELTDMSEPQTVTAADAWQRAGLAHKRLSEFEYELAAIRRAFLKDDLGTPDYEGHRRAHGIMVEASKVMQGYKVEATKRVVGWVAALLIGALSSGVIVWLQEHLK